jgi:hypothetical protein
MCPKVGIKYVHEFVASIHESKDGKETEREALLISSKTRKIE